MWWIFVLCHKWMVKWRFVIINAYIWVILLILVIYNLTPKKTLFTAKTFKNIGEYPNKNWDLSLIYEMFDKKLSLTMIVKNTVQKNPTRDVQAEIGYLLLLICTYMYPLLVANMLTKIFFAYMQVLYKARYAYWSVKTHICKLYVYEQSSSCVQGLLVSFFL